MKAVPIVFLFLQCVLLVLGTKWDRSNDPSTWDSFFQYKLDQLPTSAQALKTPWSDTYWPSYQGGIANRWQDEENSFPGFGYKTYTLEELKSGSVNLNLLSPAEKFDLFNSRYDYPLLKSEWQRCKPDDATWEGICHGWSPAAVHYDEPNHVTMKNNEGLEIPFASSDVKALLSYFMAQFAVSHERAQFIATRCNTDLESDPNHGNSSECLDINAGTFHIMLTNVIGLGGKAFVCDVDPGLQVWNQPTTKYEYILGKPRAPTRNSAPGTVKGQPVSLTMYYVKETYALRTAHKSLLLNKRYNYVLDLDAKGNILGGSYEPNQREHVDFMWAEEAPAFFGYFEQLETIYKAATGGARTRSGARRPRVSLADYKAKTVTNGSIKLSSYNESSRHSWVVPAGASKRVRLQFKSFNTRRHTDFLRVFEVENDQVGAPIAVLHGTSVPKDLSLRPGVSALVTFGVDQKAAYLMSLTKGSGFELSVQ